jgi:hypothetical protein
MGTGQRIEEPGAQAELTRQSSFRVDDASRRAQSRSHVQAYPAYAATAIGKNSPR